MRLRTSRLVLRDWQSADRENFAALNADPDVMRDLGGPLDRSKSDAKFDRFRAAFDSSGFTRWLLEDLEGRFVGYTGIMQSSADHPLGPHADIGWRLAHWSWGKGYATEAATAALNDVFARKILTEVLAYTSSDNVRSRAVMDRLGLRRDATRDFVLNGAWRGLVWMASAR